MNYLQSNKELYESEEVLKKYGANSARTRQLNKSEQLLVDQFGIKNKHVLVVGCGAGRVPANLLLFGNTVTGVDRSQGMLVLAKQNFPSERFPGLTFLAGDATDLSFLPDNSFDVAIMPQNAIDYIETIETREQALAEISKKIKKGGIVAFSSHNLRAYMFSHKLPLLHHSFKGSFRSYAFARGRVVGGGYIFMGTPAYVIQQATKVTGMEFTGYVCDTRSRLDRLFAKSLFVAQYVYGHITYIFRKHIP